MTSWRLERAAGAPSASTTTWETPRTQESDEARCGVMPASLPEEYFSEATVT